MTDLAALSIETLAAIAARRRRGRAGGGARRRARQEGLDLRVARDAGQDVARRAQDAGRGDQRAEGRGDRGARRAARVAEGGGARSAARSARRSTSRCRSARPGIETGRIHPISQVMDEITAIFADMGFSDRRRAGHRERRLQFHQAQFPARPSRRAKCTTRSSSRPTRTASASCCAPTPARCRCARC